jgi:hypothetical protein
MPTRLREYLSFGLLAATPAMLLAAVVVLSLATTFQGYIGGLLLLMLGVVTFLAARELKGKSSEADLRALFNHLTRRKAKEEQASAGN